MGIVRHLLANTLELVGIGIGNKYIPASNIAELKGFRPYPAIKISNNLDNEWQVGFYWYLRRIEGVSILDAGYVAHKEFTRVLGSLGLNVTGVDLLQDNVDNVNCIQASVWNIPLPKASINTLIANSLLEHLGLDCYKQPQVANAVDATLLEFHRVLKPKGLLLLQVPYSQESILIKHRGEKFYIPWTHSNLKSLKKHFSIEEKTCYIWARGRWIEVSWTIANKVKQGGGFPSCLVFIKARKYE